MKSIFAIIFTICLALYSVAAYADKGEPDHDDEKVEAKHEENSEAHHDEGKTTVVESTRESGEHEDNAQALDLGLHALKEKIEKLELEVARLKTIQPSFTAFMPDFSERFHVMHMAAEAGDWGVAVHELLEMQRMMKIAKLIDPNKGVLMEAFIGGNLRQIKKSIEHGNIQSFTKVLKETVQNCNNCHIAVQAPYIQVALDMDQILSMRHSHKFMITEAESVAPHTH